MQRKVITFTAGVVLIAALTLIWRQLDPPAPAFNHAPFIGIGQVLVDETVRVVHGHGRIVVVVMADQARPVMPVNGLWDGFRDELKKHDTINTIATEFTEPDSGSLPFCSPVTFQQILDRHTDADAFVFFTALPPFSMLNGSLRPGNAPKIIALDIGQTFTRVNYEGYFANGLIAALIGPRVETVPTGSVLPKTPRDYFNQQYQVFTPQNYERLPN